MSRLTDWLSRFLREDDGEPSSSDPMLAYFLSSLDVRFRKIAPNPAGVSDPVRDKAVAEIDRALGSFKTTTATFSRDAAWTEAYRIERLFVFSEPPETLGL